MNPESTFPPLMGRNVMLVENISTLPIGNGTYNDAVVGLSKTKRH
jgi:hypothetical protein